MRTLTIGETLVGNRAVIIAPDEQDKVFKGVDAGDRSRIISPWIRLTGTVINETPEQVIQEGEILDEWLSPTSRSGKLAIAENVVVSFPSKTVGVQQWPPRPNPAFPAWKMIPGPTVTALSEAPAKRW